jgi:K+-transporting ATPase c subunit
VVSTLYLPTETSIPAVALYKTWMNKTDPSAQKDELSLLEWTGSGLDPEVTLGPLNNRAQLDIVASLARRAREEGAEVTELGCMVQRHRASV